MIPPTVGLPIPQTDHAVSVSLPTWDDNVAYEEGDPKLLDKMVGGYPRFVYHPLVRKRYAELNESLLVLSSRQACIDCRDFMRKHMEPSATKVNIHITELFVTPSTITRDHPFAQFPPPVVFIILFPESLSHLAKQFWQHTGAGISSRFAEHCLTLLNVAFTKLPTESEPPNSHRKSSNASFRDISRLNDSKNETEAAKGDAAFFVEERFGRNLDPTLVREAKLAMRKRIAGVLGDSSSSQIIPLTDRGRDVNEDHVFLFPNGMAAIYFSHKVVSKILPGLKTAQFGFPYVDTLKIQQKFGFGVLFYGHGNASDLEALKSELASTKIAALYCEFPSNPLLKSPPLDELYLLAQQHGFYLIVDETIGNFVNTNCLQKCDLIVSSLTKIFSGDSNVMGGSVVVNPSSPKAQGLSQKINELYEDVIWHEDALFLERNSRKFQQRIHQINSNAEYLCESIKSHPKVVELYFPKYTTPELYNACAVSNSGSVGYGGLFSAVFSTKSHAQQFYDALQVYKGPSLGTNFTLASPYTLLAHYYELDWASNYGVSSWLVRVSVGLEDSMWLKEVFLKALDGIKE